MGLALCDRMAQDGEYTTVQHHLAYAAHKVLFSIASGAMPMPHPPLKHLARLCHMALKWQIIQPTVTGEAALNDVWQNFCQLAQLPAEFSAIALAREQVDWHVLHQSISLLRAPHDNVVVSPTVLYNPIHQDSIKAVARYLRDELTQGLNLAREKLKQLLEGQMLLLPMMSVPICPYEGTVLTGHFSAVVAVKKDEYWHFAIFDSLDDSDTEPLKEAVLAQLVPKKRGRYYFFQQHFQQRNDCAIHAFNFFSSCLTLKETYWSGPAQWGQLFDDYCQETADLKLMLGEDSTLSSTMLRRYFMLECLINGYRPDEWAMVQNEPVLRREPIRGLSLSHSFRHLLGCTGHWKTIKRRAPRQILGR
ncbi:hypothetical protein [Sodalis sp. (in: enterobacteria)]|uniref:hypothetical protein n=1 Tax=Sodalis sp. (in: enterobacteria) TaxID=1898979 RepID=UPI003F686028